VNHVKKINIEGFKSIRKAALDLGMVNVLIGANGAGKSNFLTVFQMISAMTAGELETFVGRHGRASSLLHYGPKRTRNLDVALTFEAETGESTYSFWLGFTPPDSLNFVKPIRVEMGAGHRETRLFDEAKENKTAGVVQHLLRSCRVFQFHDTSQTSPMRQASYIGHSSWLATDGGNLAAFLYGLRTQQPRYYERIVASIRQIAPFFKDFVLEPSRDNKRELFLDWRDADPDGRFGPHQLSDGTLRAMSLITLLLQPEEQLPNVVIIDEPELGLHPYAIEVIASLIKSASANAQIIIATQSPKLVDQFDPSEIIIAGRHGGETTLSRPDHAKLKEWLDEYSVGELWEKNVLGGRPTAWSA
jgi:predicted ATPase